VATVSNASGSHGLATAAGVGAATITATDPSSLLQGTAALSVTPAVLVAITVSPAAAASAKGDTQQFTAMGVYSDLSTADLTNAVTWSTSSSSVATVSNASGSAGLATAAGVGAATITATDPSSLIQGTAALTVTPAVLVAITVSPAAASTAKGDTQQFTATGVYSDLSTKDLTKAVAWSSSADTVATVSDASGSAGLATATGLGVATVTATDPSSLIQGTAALTVTPAVLVAITVSPPAASVGKGGTEQFTATGVYSDLSTADLTKAVTWSTSSSSSVATVSDASGSAGLATATGLGVSTVTATDHSSLIQGTAALTVTPAALVSITVTPANPAIVKRGTEQFTATGQYSDLTTVNLTDVVTWSSTAPRVATVSNASGSNGKATGVSAGSTTIVATDPVTGTQGSTQLAVGNVPALGLAPASGRARTPLVVVGGHFPVGVMVKVRYLTGLAKPTGVALCEAHVRSNGSFRCRAMIPMAAKAGAAGSHTVVAVVPGAKIKAIAIFMLRS